MSDSDYDSPTRKVGSPTRRNTARAGGEGVTRPAGRPAGGRTSTDNDDAKTQIYRPGRKSGGDAITQSNPTGSTAKSSGASAMDDPPAGWLVVVKGPGMGSVVTIGIGSNSIGRDPGERISLDFGDEHISREGHAVVTYDPRGKKFYIQHGGGKNLTYLNDEPVLAPSELTPDSVLVIGETTLRFVPLCGPEFNWEDLEAE